MADTMLKDVSDYKKTIMDALMDDTNILTCLLGENYNQEAVSDIVYSQIFPYLYADETQTSTKTYIGIEVDPNASSGTIKDSKLIIWEYCHKDIMGYSKNGYIGTRVDFLADKIDNVIREQNLGIGKPEFISAKYFFPISKYYGRVLLYNIPDFKIKDK